jgi:hypothetical protein
VRLYGHDPQPRLDRDFAVGLGYWLIDPIGLDGERLASHGGDLPPFHSVLVTLPDAGVAVFLAANTSTARGTVITMASDIVRAVYASVTGRTVSPPSPPARTAIDAATAASLAGLYASPMGLLEVRARKTALFLRLGRLPLRLVPRSDGTYTPEIPLLRLLNFHPEALRGLTVKPFRLAGKQYLQIAAAGVTAGAAERFTPSPLSASWLERTGRYRIIQGGSAGVRQNLSELELVYDRKKELLLFRFRLIGQPMSFPLEVLAPDTAILAGTGTGLGDTLSWSEGRPVGTLHWSGLTLIRED